MYLYHTRYDIDISYSLFLPPHDRTHVAVFLLLRFDAVHVCGLHRSYARLIIRFCPFFAFAGSHTGRRFFLARIALSVIICAVSV